MDENFLNDQEILGQFVDALIHQKPGELRTPAEQKVHRNRLMHQLDDQLAHDLFDKLSDDQLPEAERILDNPSATADDYEQLFARAGIDIEQSFTDTAQRFAKNYLGGQNAN